MNENEKWLKETGYKQRDFDGSYIFEYKKDEYGAYHLFNLYEVISWPLNELQYAHANFIERAERKEIF